MRDGPDSRARVTLRSPAASHRDAGESHDEASHEECNEHEWHAVGAGVPADAAVRANLRVRQRYNQGHRDSHHDQPNDDDGGGDPAHGASLVVAVGFFGGTATVSSCMGAGDGFDDAYGWGGWYSGTSSPFPS